MTLCSEALAAQGGVHPQRPANLVELGDPFGEAMPVPLRCETGEYLLQVLALKDQVELLLGRFHLCHGLFASQRRGHPLKRTGEPGGRRKGLRRAGKPALTKIGNRGYRL